MHSGVHTLTEHSNEIDPTFTFLSCDDDAQEAGLIHTVCGHQYADMYAWYIHGTYLVLTL